MKVSRFGPRYLLSALICVALLCVGGFGYYDRTTTSVSRSCRVCSAFVSRDTVTVFGVNVWSRDSGVRKGADTRDYFDRYLAYSHDHEWAGGSLSVLHRGSIGCGVSGDPSQMELARMGYRLVAMSGIDDPQLRRQYFESIIHPPGAEHYLRVSAEYEKKLQSGQNSEGNAFSTQSP